VQGHRVVEPALSGGAEAIAYPRRPRARRRVPHRPQGRVAEEAEIEFGRPGDATVAQLLDMTAALEFNEDYADPDSDVQAQDRAAGWRPRR
jgi:CubicO group peptidase (beta-lactamase class C family)